MSIFAYARRLQVEAECDVFVPTFGIPVDQDFGDVASEGASTDLSRSDHRHGMPDLGAFIDDLEETATYFNDLVLTALVQDIKAAGTTTIGGRDDEGDLGGFGTLDATAVGGAGTAGAWIQNTSGGQTGNTTTPTHPFKRTEQFLARVRPVLTQTELVSCTFACGFIRTTTNLLLSTIVDGVYFFLQTDGLGAGTYHIIAKDNTSTTDIDTGISPRLDGSNNVLFDIFQITFDGTTAVFFLNTVNVGAISTNIPPGTRKTCGFGAWLNNNTALNRTMVADVYAWTGRRSYTE